MVCVWACIHCNRTTPLTPPALSLMVRPLRCNCTRAPSPQQSCRVHEATNINRIMFPTLGQHQRCHKPGKKITASGPASMEASPLPFTSFTTTVEPTKLIKTHRANQPNSGWPSRPATTRTEQPKSVRERTPMLFTSLTPPTPLSRLSSHLPAFTAFICLSSLHAESRLSPRRCRTLEIKSGITVVGNSTTCTNNAVSSYVRMSC
jgi:hypothetical protein